SVALSMRLVHGSSICLWTLDTAGRKWCSRSVTSAALALVTRSTAGAATADPAVIMNVRRLTDMVLPPIEVVTHLVWRRRLCGCCPVVLHHRPFARERKVRPRGQAKA